MLGPHRAAPGGVGIIRTVRIREVCGCGFGMLPHTGTLLVPWVRNASSMLRCGRAQCVLGKCMRVWIG